MAATSRAARAAPASLTGRAPLEHRAQTWVLAVGQRNGARARILDAERTFLALRIDLDRDAHGRARPAVDERSIVIGAALAPDDRSPLGARPLGRARAQPQPDHGDRRPRSFRRAVSAVRLGELDDD